MFDLIGWQAEVAKQVWQNKQKVLAGRRWQKCKLDKVARKLIQKFVNKQPSLQRQEKIDGQLILFS